MLGRAGEHEASMHGLVVKWVVSGATTMYRRSHAANKRVAAAVMHPDVIILVNWLSYGWENKLAISCLHGANSRVPDACKQSFSFRKEAIMAQQTTD